MPRYKANGRVYDIPEEKTEAFEKRYPNAAVRIFDNDGREYHLPVAKKGAFQKKWDKWSYAGQGSVSGEPAENEPQRQQPEPQELHPFTAGDASIPQKDTEDSDKGWKPYQPKIDVLKREDESNIVPPQQPSAPAPLSENEKREVLARTDGMLSQVKQASDEFKEFMDSNREYLDKHGLGQVVEGKRRFNPASGKIEQTYLTPDGNRYFSREKASRLTTDVTAAGQLREAYRKLNELKAKREASAQRVDEEVSKYNRENLTPLGRVLIGGNMYINKQRSDLENRALDVAIRQTEETIKDLEEQKDRERGIDVGFWRGFGRGVSDVRTWDFGMGDLKDGMTMMDADALTGESATEDEHDAYNEMMSALYKKNEVEQKYGDNASFWNRAGVMTGFMPAFMIDFALTGGGFAGVKAGAKIAGKAAIKAIGKEAVEQMAKQGFKTFVRNNGLKGLAREAGNWTIKALGTTADDIMRGTAMSNTIQAGKTAADIIGRKQGDVVVDENGNYAFANDKTWGSAIWQGEANSIIENYSEMFGAHLDPVMTPGNLSKLANVVGAKRIGAVLAKADAGALKGIMGQTRQLFDKMGVSDYFGEVSEEYNGQLWRTMLNLDDAYRQNPDGTRTNLLATGQFHGDIWGGMALSMGLMGAGKAIITGAQYAHAKHGVNKADNRASELLGKETWESLRAMLDLITNDEIGNVAETIVNDNDFTVDEKSAVLDYLERSMYMRGLNLATLAQKRGGEQDEDVQSMNESYIDGYNIADSQEMTDARNMLDYQRQQMLDVVGTNEETLDSNTIDWLAEAHNARNSGTETGKKRAQTIIDYLNARQVYEGMMQRVRDDIDGRIDQSNAMIDARTHRKTGTIQGATMKQDDRRVYVVNGSLVQYEDKSGIDINASDGSVIILDAETGKLEQVSPDAILNIDEPQDPAEQKAAAAEAIRQQAAREAADRIDGLASFNVGDAYTITGEDGKQAQVQIAANEQGAVDNGDGTVNVSDGTKVFPVSKEVIQQQVDAANKARVAEFEQQRAAENAAAEQAAREAARPDYAVNDRVTMRDADGNVIHGEITEHDKADDKFVVEVDTPIGGRYVVNMPREQLDGMVVEHNGKPVEKPATDVTTSATDDATLSTESTPHMQPSDTEGATSATDAATPSTDNATSATDNTTSIADVATSVTPATDARQPAIPALDRIPKDAQGNPVYEQAETPDLAWDAIVEQAEGDEAMAQTVADGMVADKEAALKKLEKAKSKGGVTVAEKIAAEKERKAAIDAAQQELDIWKQIAGTANRRKLEAEAERRRKAEEAAAARKAEEEKMRAERKEAERIEREALNGVPDMVDDTPQDARARGYRRVNGHKVDRQGTVRAVQGKEVAVKFSDDIVPTGHAALIDVSQLQPSHIGGRRNPQHFIDEAQPKERNDKASVMSASRIAGNIRPEEITSSVTAYTGAPTVNTRGEVIQGNNRSAALKEMWDTQPEQAAKYKQYLIDHAQEFGLNAEDVAAMERPVLVNMLDVDDAEAIALGQYMSHDTESGGTERIRPRNVLQRMGADMRTFANMLLNSSDEDTSIDRLADNNGTEVLKWMQRKGYISPTQYNSAFDSKGNLARDAKNDLKDVLYESIFQGGGTNLKTMFDNIPAKAQRAILATAFRDFDSPDSERMIEEIQNSIRAYHALSLYKPFAEAKNWEEARLAVEAWKRQYQFDDVSGESYLPAENFSNFALHLATMYRGESQSYIQGTFNRLYDLIQGTQEATLLDQPDNTPHTLAQAIKEVLKIDYNGQQRSDVLGGNITTGQRGKRGSTGDVAAGERAAAGDESTDDRGGTEIDSGLSRRDGTQETGSVRQSASLDEEARGQSIRLTSEGSDRLLAQMEEKADVVPNVELTPTAWRDSFGDSGSIDTPMGRVKMGENQITKFFAKGREKEFGMVAPTLSNPDIVIEKTAPEQNAERDTKLLFIKTFIKPDGSRYVHFESVTVLKGGMEVSISSHEASRNALKKEMQNGLILHLNEKLSLSSEWYLTETPAKEGPDLVPTSDNNNILHSRHTTTKQSAETVEASQKAEQNGTQTSSSMDAPTTSSESEDTAPLSEKQEKGKENSADANEEEEKKDKSPSEVALEELGDIEQEWNDKIIDYVAEHYPTQATISAKTNSPQGLKEKAVMEKDETLKRMRAEAKAAIDAADEKVTALYKAEQEDEKKNSASDNTTDTVGTVTGKRNDTATPQNTVSTDKDSEKSGKTSGTKKKAEPVSPRVLGEAYESGDAAKIAEAEKAIRDYIEAQEDIMALANTYNGRKGEYEYYAKKTIGFKETPRGKLMSFLAEVCKESLMRKYGVPKQAFGSAKTRAKLASETTDPNVLDVLSNDRDSDVKIAVINNPNTSDELLRYIIENNHYLYTPHQEAKKALERRGLKQQRIGENAPVTREEKALRSAIVRVLRKMGLETFDDAETGQRVLDWMNGKGEQVSAEKKRALETASVSLDETSSTAISSADGTKIVKKLDLLSKEYENRNAKQTKTFIGEVADALGIQANGKSSKYATFETKSGRRVTIRLSNHNATVSNFDNKNEVDGISIVVTSSNNNGVLNNGSAHIVEFYYNSMKLRRADGKPLSDIVKSIKQALYSGEYKDTTGLAEVQEVNAETIREHRVFHGSGTDFDAFDHSHMGEGEGAQAYGWGSYVTEVEGIGRTYAEKTAGQKYNQQINKLARSIESKKDFIKTRKSDIRKNEDYEKYAKTIRRILRNNLKEYKAAEKAGNESDMRFYQSLINISEQQLKPETHKHLIDSFWNDVNSSQEEIDRMQSEMDELKAKLKDVQRHLYTVEIPDDNGSNYLDWNGRPTDEQMRAITAQVDKEGIITNIRRDKNGILYPLEDGRDLYKTLGMAKGLRGDKAVSEFLSRAGFTGIKYPAEATTGGRADGAKNYVIFKESDMKITDHVRFFKTAEGEAYGFTVGGKIYLDPRMAKADTPIHEYTHLWADALRQMNPTEWKNIVELMKGTPVWDEVKRNYPELETEDEIADEVLATYSGLRGAERLREQQRKIAESGASVFEKAEAISVLERVKDALKKFWKNVADFLHIHFTTAEEVADRVLSDLLNGVNPLDYTRADGRLRMQEQAEEQTIIEQAKANGTYMKAPNGKPTNLTEKQWVQVRTKAFKKWFGDWEKAARIEKLRHSEPIVVSGDEYKGKYELNSRSAGDYIIGSLRGEYVNKDTGNVINITRSSQKVAHHDAESELHLKSIAYIPQMIENAVFIGELENEKGAKFDKYRYYVVGLKIDGVDYTAKIVIGQKNGESYYDHALTEIEKNNLLNLTDGVKADVSDKEVVLSDIKDSRLLSILQTNSSKIVDENGEPLVVYRGSPEELGYTFEYGQNFYGGNKGFWFTSAESSAKDYSFNDTTGEYGEVKDVFLNARNVMDLTPLKRRTTSKEFCAFVKERYGIDLGRGGSKEYMTHELYEKYQDYLYPGSHDAVKLVDVGHTYIVKTPNQIKSATDNMGAFSRENNDIRYQFIGERGAESIDRAEEATVRMDNLRTAREMEQAGKDAKAVKMATGWERGADGKWRYEIPDGRFDSEGELHPERFRLSESEHRELEDMFEESMEAFEKGSAAYPHEIDENTDMADIYEAGGMERSKAERLAFLEEKERALRTKPKHLDDYLDNESLFSAYPQLRDVTVRYKFDANISKLGGYNPAANEITFNIGNRDVLLHEVQHAIQYIEGFAKGGSPSTVRAVRSDNMKTRHEVERLLDDLGYREWLGNADPNSIQGNFVQGRNFNTGYAFSESLPETPGKELRKKLDQANRIIADNNKLIGGSSSLTPEEHYRSLAGEVEARNVEKRAGMTDEERRNTLASETEDVAREDQIFLRENMGGVSESRARYSKKDNAQENRDLVAVHNITAEKLAQALELGGFPMPSIAVTKADVGHTTFGDISLVFGKESIDPSDRRNKVYGEDAWTPVFPQVGYKLNEEKTDDIYRRANKAGKLPMFNPSDLHPTNYENRITDLDSKSVADSFKNDYGMKQLYLSENGNAVKEYVQREEEKYAADKIGLYEKVLEEIGLERLKKDDSGALRDEIKQLIARHRGIDINKVHPFLISGTIQNAIDYAENGNKRLVSDVEATQKKIDERIDPKKYEAWLEDLFSGIVEKKGIRNAKDPFTLSGNRRKWEELYDRITLDNVVGNMQKQTPKGSAATFGFAPNRIFGAAQEEYKSVDEIREAARERIRNTEDSDYEAQRQAIVDRLRGISIPGSSDTMDIMQNIQDAVARSHTPKGIHKYLKEFYPKVTIETAEEIADIVKDIQKLSARFFEAKPRRAVGFDEVRLAVVPSDADANLVAELESRGIPVRRYEKGNEDERRQIVEAATDEMDLRFRQAEETKAGEQDRDAMRVQVEQVAGKLHLGNVEIVTDKSGLQGRKGRAKGFYDPKTGKITIVLPNNANVEDAVKTLLHEAVAHHGLRKLFGEHFDTFLDNVFNNASEDVRRRIVELSKKHGWNFRTATEEYLASLAEKTDFENIHPSWWKKIKDFFIDMLQKAGIDLRTYNDNDLRYILWRSYENLRGDTGVFAEAADIAKQYELRVGEYAARENDDDKAASDEMLRSEESEKRNRINRIIDQATAFVMGKTEKEAREIRRNNERKRKEDAKKMYDAVLRGNFNSVTLQQINDYIDHATPENPYGRRISQRIPQRMERALHAGARTNAVDALFSRICESAEPKATRTSREGRRRIEEKKKELLKGWAIATGNWHTDLSDFTDDKKPIDGGKDSDVYLSKDGNHVIKVSKGKNEEKRFSPDIDAVTLFNGVFPNNAYKIVGYGEIDGRFVKFLEQPFVDFGNNAKVSEEERVEYMHSLGFEPINKERTAFSNGQLVVADIQKNNIVKDKSGNITVIDADVKLHTKDIGGKYSYPDVETDTDERFRDGESDVPESIREANERFNEELRRYQGGEMEQNEMFHLGQPENVMRRFLPKLPIVMRPRVMNKASNTKHNVEASSLKDLPQMISAPIFVFKRSDKVIGILTEIKDRNGLNVCVAIELDKKIQNGGEFLEVNDIRSVHGRNASNLILPIIHNDTLAYVDKEKGLAYLSSASYNYQQEIDKQDLDSAVKVIENFENPNTREENVGDEVLFRDGDPEIHERERARDRYERRMKSGLYQSREALQDSMLSLKEAMTAILGKKTHIEEVEGYENAYLGENRLSSKNQADTDAFGRLLFKPMLDEVARLARNETERGELTDYMMAKHGLERNRIMAERDAQEAFDKNSKAHPTSKKTLHEFIGECRQKDYAGLTALTGMDNVADAEAEAQRMVDAYEAAHDTAALWNKVRAVNKAILQKSFECGMMSRETFDKVSSMYEYYIPLRGFDEKTSSEAYAYLTHKESAFNAPIKAARGRKSKADDPFANMETMAESAIMQGNRNVLVKQRFLNFVLNHPSDLVSVSDLWLQYDAVADEWKPVFPEGIETTDTPEDVERKMQDFETRMEALAAAEPDKYKRGKDAANIPYRVITNRDLQEHQVIVKRGGRDIVLTVNGNPRLAQALNGQTNPDNDMAGFVRPIFRLGEKINRELSAFYTTRNPDFVLSNFLRDMLYTNTMVWVKESPNYALRFHRHCLAEANPANMKILLAKHRKGTLDMSDKTEAMFHHFMMNGGETGYANIRDIEKHRNDIRRELKKANGRIPVQKALGLLGERLDEYNRAIENAARFAAFMTSREMGRSLDRAIYDAKEISVNFNKKGSGAVFIGKPGQKKIIGNVAAFVSGFGRAGYVFWNAAIQGTTNIGRQFKRHPAKAFTGMAAMYLLGALVASIGGDDDDDDKNAYYNLPEYVRRSNILFRAGDYWISIPLPVEYRAVYGLGELMASTLSGKEHLTDGELAEAIAAQVSQCLPLDFMEGGGGMNAFIPSFAKPWAEARAGKSWTGLPLYKDTPFNKNMPEWTKAYSSANKSLVGLAAALNEATGGDKYTKGAVDINPAKVEAMLSGYFGGVAGTIDKMTKMAETFAGKREYDPRSFLLLNRVLKAGDERTEYRAVNNEYRRLKDEHDQLKGRIRGYENDTSKGIFDYAEKIDFLYNSPEYRRYEIFEEYRPDIEALDKELKEVREREPYGEDAKQIEAYLNEVKKEMIQEMNLTRERK